MKNVVDQPRTIDKNEWENLIRKIRKPNGVGNRGGNKIISEILMLIIKQAEEDQWEHLNLRCAGIAQIPKEISKLKKLKSLSFENSSFIEESELTNSITELPEELFDLVNLESLNLEGCPIIRLPSGISKLKSLSSLNLSNNKIDSLPEELFMLENLKELHIDNTLIESIPPAISKLKKLSTLYFHRTKILIIPKEVFELKKLTYIGLCTKEIPQAIKNLSELRYLLSSNSELTELPNEIGDLTKLEYLHLFGCNLTYLPNSMKNLENLKKIDLAYSPLQNSIPPEIMNQPAKDIVNYIIRFQEDTNKIKLNESKMLIVGQGGVGKSSLLHMLVHKKNSDSTELDSTEGIDIEQWSFHFEDKDYKLNVWDFGGQEIYHSTHQFFLTNRSMYILVWDARQEDEYGRIDYWLNTVESFAGDSPILLVINKCDERKNVKHIDLKSLKNNFPQIVDAYKVSCLNGMGINELKQSIIKESINLPLTNIVWLSSWIDIRNHLEQLAISKDLVSYSEYQKICNKYEVEEGEAKSLSRYLHDLGIVLHFHEDILLKDFVILNPEWGTDAVYKVLDAKDELLRDRNGILYIEDLDNIWTDKRVYPKEKFSLILRLMENFQLSFEVERNKVYLVPELMGTEEIELTDTVFNDETCLTFEYEYDFLPAGMMTRFIVKAHKHLLDWSENNKACWKKGAYLKHKDALGKVRLFDNVSNKRIEIHIAGSNMRQNRDLLQRIRVYFEEIHSSINKLKLTERIQCNCKPKCAHKFDYKNLIRFEEHGHMNAVCNESMLKVSVTALLDGIESLTDREKEREKNMKDMPQIIVNNTINNENQNSSKSENSNLNDNINRNEVITTISIDIRNMIDGLHGDLQDMKEEVITQEPKLTKGFEKIEQALNKLNAAESKEEIVRSGVLKKFNRFIQEMQDEESLLGQTIKNIKHGASIAQDIADKYNSVAEWCGIPVVPKLFLKK
jgi:internalin A